MTWNTKGRIDYHMKTEDQDKKSNLVAIPAREDACPHVVKQLEELLESAKSGEIRNFFIVAEVRNDDPLFVQVGENSPLKTLGLLEWAKSRWIVAALEHYEEE